VPLEIPTVDVCPFCRNVSGLPVVSARDGETVGCAVIETMDQTLAFINPRQLASPHVLIIPKRHAATILDLTSHEATSIMLHIHRLARAVSQEFSPAGLNIYQNNGSAAGQSVGHFHFHIVPTYAGGTVCALSTRDLPRTPLPERELLAGRLREALARIGDMATT